MIKSFRYLGILSLFFGVSLLINSSQKITGYSILDDIEFKGFSITGLILIIGGVVMLYVSEDKKEIIRNKEGKIINIVKTQLLLKLLKNIIGNRFMQHFKRLELDLEMKKS